MSRFKYNLIELDVNKIFVEHKVDEIVEIEKLLDAEIERKRTELRSMVGDRYKDILTASDSIKSMKNISTQIVDSIEQIEASCKALLVCADSPEHVLVQPDDQKINERVLAIQVRLTIAINEAIWVFLDREDYLSGAQLYLLGQNIHTGLSFLNSLHKVPLLKQVKDNLTSIRDIILSKIIKKLESIELTSEQTCSNLNSLMLLQNQNTNQLMSIFMDHRKTALSTVINISHSSVRLQISAMMKCLITTIHLLHDCFMSGSQNGLIFKQIDEIMSEQAQPTLSKVNLPFSPLLEYIPQLIKEFRPKCNTSFGNEPTASKENFMEGWLENTKETVQSGLRKSLSLVTNIKGLHFIREEALKIEMPADWENICEAVNLPRNFDLWNYFFQSLITERAQELIASKLHKIMDEFKGNIEDCLSVISNSNVNELDLRTYVWTEDARDVRRSNKRHTGLSMKALGFSQAIVTLSEKFDEKFLDLLNDMYQYLYGAEFDGTLTNSPFFVRDNAHIKKHVDVDILQNCLVQKCSLMSFQLSEVLSLLLQEEMSEQLVKKTLFSIRLLQAITKLCPFFKKCCSINNVMEEWTRICDSFSKYSTQLWKFWVDYSVKKTEKTCSVDQNSLDCRNTLAMYLRWDYIEIQEQTEDKVFKSQIKVPLKPSTFLIELLANLNDDLCRILPHTLPKIVHVMFIENNVEVIFNSYKKLLSCSFNQNHALQLLFDIKFLTIFCIRRENDRLINISQDICDKLRGNIDPFDLDVFYSYLQNNAKEAAIQFQVVLGCLLPSFKQTSNIEILEKNKEHEKDPCILALSNPSSNVWFPLLPMTAPSHKHFIGFSEKDDKISSKPIASNLSKKSETASVGKTNASSLFGGLTTDWFS